MEVNVYRFNIHKTSYYFRYAFSQAWGGVLPGVCCGRKVLCLWNGKVVQTGQEEVVLLVVNFVMDSAKKNRDLYHSEASLLLWWWEEFRGILIKYASGFQTKHIPSTNGQAILHCWGVLHLSTFRHEREKIPSLRESFDIVLLFL